MRTGRRYSRSAGTRSSGRGAADTADWLGSVRTVSSGPGLARGTGGTGIVVPVVGVAATAGCGIPSTGTGPGGGEVGSGFPSASTTPASHGAVGPGRAVASQSAPFGRSPGAPIPEATSDRLASMTGTA